MLMTLNFVTNRFVMTLRPPPGGPIAAINCILSMYFLVCFWRLYLLIIFYTFVTTGYFNIFLSMFLLHLLCSFSPGFVSVVFYRILHIIPKSVINPLPNQFQRWLRSVFLLHGHIKIVHESDHSLTARGNINSFLSFLQSAFYCILNQEGQCKTSIPIFKTIIHSIYVQSLTCTLPDVVWADIFTSRTVYFVSSRSSSTEWIVDVFPVPTGPTTSTGKPFDRRELTM